MWAKGVSGVGAASYELATTKLPDTGYTVSLQFIFWKRSGFGRARLKIIPRGRSFPLLRSNTAYSYVYREESLYACKCPCLKNFMKALSVIEEKGAIYDRLFRGRSHLINPRHTNPKDPG